MEKYIPYSQRHNITEHDLAGLLDYLERVMGWEIELQEQPETGTIVIKSKQWTIMLFSWKTMSMFAIEETELEGKYRSYLHDFLQSIFFRSYKTLLPVIRDLYSK